MIRATRVLARANKDIERIFDWLGVRSTAGAGNWYDALLLTFDRIGGDPTAYPLASEACLRWSRQIREALFKTSRGKRYRIVFEVTDIEVLILRVRGPGQPPLRKRDLPIQ